MQLTCRSCRRPIPSEDVSLDTVLAKCRACHAVFDFSDQVRLPKVPEAKLKRDRGEIPLPKQFNVEEGTGQLSIICKWPRAYPTIAGLMLLSISIIAMAGTLLAALVWSPGKLEGTTLPAGLMKVLLTLFLLPGVGMAWLSLALLFNRTKIQVEGRRLKILIRPIPWPGNHDLDTASVDQLYCEEYFLFTKGDVPQYRYALMALCKDGTKLKLVRDMDEVEQVFFLERLLEKHLGIADRPVSGGLQDGFTG